MARPAATDRPRFHDSTLIWDQSATAQTLGVGADYQSRNPVYEMTFLARPRWYFIEKPELELSARAELGVIREFTDSDVTTRRGEWSATDAELSTLGAVRFRQRTEYVSELGLRLPLMNFATSRVSAESGKLLTLGLGVMAAQHLPLNGSGATFLRGLDVRALAQYGYLFTRTHTPTNAGFERIRMGPEGRSIPTDQLDGAAFAPHQLTLGVSMVLDIAERIALESAFFARPAWKFGQPDGVRLCGVLDTGCSEPARPPDPQTYSLITLYRAQLIVQLWDEVGISAGYANIASQLGRDGQRRNPFYSPEARVFLSLILTLNPARRLSRPALARATERGSEL